MNHLQAGRGRKEDAGRESKQDSVERGRGWVGIVLVSHCKM